MPASLEQLGDSHCRDALQPVPADLLDSMHLSRAARSAVEKSREEVDRWLEMKFSYFPGCTAHSTSREYTPVQIL